MVGFPVRRGGPLEHRQIVNPDRPFALAPPSSRGVSPAVEGGLEGFLVQIDISNDCARDVRTLVGDRFLDFDRPFRRVRRGNVHPSRVAVLIPHRAGDALDGEPIEAVRRELEFELAVLRAPFELEAEAEQVVDQVVVALFVVAGQIAQFVGVDIDGGHQ